MTSRAEQAARNNARWCDTVCRAHGLPGEFHAHLWLNRRPVPRYYPNAVTLSNTGGTSEQRAALQGLIAEGTLDNLAVKDSFCALDLAPLAFQFLFEATWLWRAPSRPEPISVMDGIQWAGVQEPSELARWETAWNGLPADEAAALPARRGHPCPPHAPMRAMTARSARIFPAALLDDEDLVFIAAYQGPHIVAGAIANRTEAVVGLSNVFVPPMEAARFWAGCVAAGLQAFPGLPLVGYERGEELIMARQLGFDDVGPLRVWVRANLRG